MHQSNTGSCAEVSPYCFGSAESTTCWLFPDLVDDLLLLVDGVNLLHLPEGADLLRISQKELSSSDPVAKWLFGDVAWPILSHPARNVGREGGGVVDAPGRPLVTCFPQPRLSYQEFQPYLSFAATRSSFNKILDQVDPNSLYLHCHSFYWHFDAWPARPRFFLAFSLPKCHSYRSCNNLQLL